MDFTRGTKSTSRNATLISLPGSVLESKMKIEQNVENTSSNSNNGVLRPKQGLIGISGKRKTLKSESSEKNPIQISKQKPESKKNLGEQCKEISASVDGIKKSPIQNKRTRSVSQKGGDGIEKNSIPLRKSKSESNKAVNESGEGNGELRKVKSDSDKDEFDLIEGVEGSVKDKFDLIEGVEGSVEAIEEQPDGNLDENVEGIDFCEEKVMTSDLGNVGQLKSPSKMEVNDEFDEDLDEELKEEIEEEIEIEIEKQSVNVKEIHIEEEKPNKVVIEEKEIPRSNGKSIPNSPIVRKQIPSVVDQPKIIPKLRKTKPIPVADELKRVPKTHSKLQSLVDLMMWRDVSKSAFIFGLGTFTIISSSYTTDLNISLISVVSYMGLVYLAAIFFFRSIIRRGGGGGIDRDDDTSEAEYVVGEEEALWLLKLVLPYINEFLLKIRSLFSGDPSTTMKLAVLLFVLARCGSSITIWKMTKLGFFGVFTVPKVCSSYSPQLTAYGTFWIRRFRDAWETCSHKKAVSFGIFTLVWNMSSVVARIWAVFMLIVAFKYYQHSMTRDELVEEGEEDSCPRKAGGERQRSRPTTSVEIKRKKKG